MSMFDTVVGGTVILCERARPYNLGARCWEFALGFVRKVSLHGSCLVSARLISNWVHLYAKALFFWSKEVGKHSTC